MKLSEFNIKEIKEEYRDVRKKAESLSLMPSTELKFNNANAFTNVIIEEINSPEPEDDNNK